ncbi:MAG: hypothetical protein MUC65_07025 [Pontiellaceae bacterium]|jgi:ERCC4-type nuclease|nr:hypothetical protein [Pontiellaceae bacterium]
MLIRIDTREQHPLAFIRCAAVRGTVPTFDYSLEGDQLHFAIERKSLSDLVSSLAIQKNYCRELEKGSGKGVGPPNSSFFVTHFC